jgi:hypothetical protein
MVDLTRIEMRLDRVVLGVERIAGCLEQLLPRPSDGRDGSMAGVDAHILARLFHDPDLPRLLASVATLARRLREMGCDVPVVQPRNVGQIPREIWPFAREPPRWLPPRWLRGFLDPTTPALCRQVIAALLAARSEATPCWDAGEPKPRVQAARAAALLRTAAKACLVDREASGAAWWTVGWQPSTSPRARPLSDVFDWFVRALRGQLHEGPWRANVEPRSEEQPPVEEQPPPAIVQARRGRRRVKVSARPRATPRSHQRR